MMQNLQWRGAVILVVLIASVVLIYPSIGPVPEAWSKYFPASPIRLGLDLQGGLHMVLESRRKKPWKQLWTKPWPKSLPS